MPTRQARLTAEYRERTEAIVAFINRSMGRPLPPRADIRRGFHSWSMAQSEVDWVLDWGLATGALKRGAHRRIMVQSPVKNVPAYRPAARVAEYAIRWEKFRELDGVPFTDPEKGNFKMSRHRRFFNKAVEVAERAERNRLTVPGSVQIAVRDCTPWRPVLASEVADEAGRGALRWLRGHESYPPEPGDPTTETDDSELLDDDSDA